MASGKNGKGQTPHRQRHNEMIRTTELIDRVQCFALSKPDPHRPVKLDEEGERVRCKVGDKDALPCVMDANQLRAALSLINKRLPDLRAIEVTIADMTDTLEDLTTAELQALAQGIPVERFSVSKTTTKH